MKLCTLDDDKVLFGIKPTRIYPTEEQQKILLRFITLYRNVYNWAIEVEKAFYHKTLEETGKRKIIRFNELCKMFTKVRKTHEYSFLSELPVNTGREALKDAIGAWELFLSGLNNEPKFKSRKTSRLCFKSNSRRSYIKDGGVRIEGLPKLDTISLRHHFFDGYDGTPGYNTHHYCCVQINYDDLQDQFSLIFSYSVDKIKEAEYHNVGIGIDVGISPNVILSDGRKYSYNKDRVRKYEKKLSRLDRAICRDRNKRTSMARRERTNLEEIPKSKREIKREIKRRKLYKRIHNIKEDFCQKVSNTIIRNNPEVVSMETIRVTKLIKNNRRMTKEILSFPTYHFSEMVGRKCKKYNIPFHKCSETYPSTKICSVCGYVNDTIGRKKSYVCPSCGTKLDRDVNAAINILNDAYCIRTV